MHLPLVDVAACFDNLEPAQVLDGFVRTLNGLINGVLDGSGRGASEFDEFIDWIFHTRFFRYRRRTVSWGIRTNDWWIRPGDWWTKPGDWWTKPGDWWTRPGDWWTRPGDWCRMPQVLPAEQAAPAE